MTRAGPISLLTDFGLADPYVGVMKGVLLRECPEAAIVDLSHSVAPGDCGAAAFWLERTFFWFPRGSVHVAVVDPGVGTSRQALLVSAHGHYFVAPDNGLLSALIVADREAVVRVIDVAAIGLPVPGRTFHGRDVFAPVAGRLAQGSLAFEGAGPVATRWCAPITPSLLQTAHGWLGQVLVVDRFGNAITNLNPPLEAGYELHVAGRRLPLRDTYGAASPGEVCGIHSSFGTLELAQRDGHAARTLGIGVGATVELRRAE